MRAAGFEPAMATLRTWWLKPDLPMLPCDIQFDRDIAEVADAIAAAGLEPALNEA